MSEPINQEGGGCGCACVSHDAVVCYRHRYKLDSFDLDEDDFCECLCHDWELED